MMTVPSVAHNPALRARAVQYGPLVAERDVDVSAIVVISKGFVVASAKGGRVENGKILVEKGARAIALTLEKTGQT